MPQESETPVPFEPAGPERSFGVGHVHQSGDKFRGFMRTGRWNTDSGGGSCAGALGVLVDDVLGSSVLVTRPEGTWSVSTEITIDVVADLPTDGSALTCVGRAVRRDASGGLARGEVLDDQGGVIAVATQRQRFLPQQSTSVVVPRPAPSPRTGHARNALEAIGGATNRHDAGVDLVVPGSPELANPAGNVHGGISLCASDLLGAVLLDDPDAPLVTASVHTAYLRPMPIVGPTTYTGQVVHRGRSLGVARVVGRSAVNKICTVTTVVQHAAGHR